MGTLRVNILACLLCATVLPACTGKKTVVITTPIPPPTPTKSAVHPPPTASIPPPVVQPTTPAESPPPVPETPLPLEDSVPPEKIGPPRPPALLVPQTAHQQDHDQAEVCKVRIARTEAKLAQLDPTRLSNAQEGLYLTIQSFLTKAKTALDRKDLLRASTLSEKALTLADELANHASH